MHETIQALIELQTVDDEVIGYKRQREELSVNLESLRGILGRMRDELADKREKLAEATKFYTDKQADLQVDAERIARAKTKLSSVTRTKEYAAMQREMDALRKKYTDDENELKGLSAAIEEFQSSIAADEQKLTSLEDETRDEESTSADRLAELDKLIGEIESRKDAARSKLPPNILTRYQRVLKRRENKAVVAAAGGKCTGCQMRLPPQVFIQVQRGEQLISCKNCSRYLFFDAALHDDMTGLAN